MKKKPVHPGRVLLEEWMEPFGISQNSLARFIRVPPRRINEIIHGKRSITVDTAIRFGEAFATSPLYWMALQAEFDIEVALHAPGVDYSLCWDPGPALQW
jgi:addiction module HigA family antidote